VASRSTTLVPPPTAISDLPGRHAQARPAPHPVIRGLPTHVGDSPRGPSRASPDGISGARSTAVALFGVLGGAPSLRGLIIRLIIQTIGRDRSGAVWTDDAPDVSRPDPSGADQIDAEHQATDLAVGGSNPSRCATITTAQCSVTGLLTVIGPLGCDECDHVGGHFHWDAITCDHNGRCRRHSCWSAAPPHPEQIIRKLRGGGCCRVAWTPARCKGSALPMRAGALHTGRHQARTRAGSHRRRLARRVLDQIEVDQL
jgi:hypothetical protein